nr:hypothetical protein [Tanacetum cinerariifolium]
MTTLAEHIIVAGAENHLPMLEKSMYNSWASRIRLFIKGKKHGRTMLDSIDNGQLVYPTVEENKQTKPKKYSELTKAQQIQGDCDVEATNIILHGLPPDVYALITHQKAVKDIWDRVKMLMKGNKLSYQEHLNAQLQEMVFAITALKNDLKKLKGKNVDNTAVSKPNATIALRMFKLDIELISPRLKNTRDAHKELLVYASQTCPNSPKPSEKLVDVTPMNKDKRVRFFESIASSSNIPEQTNSLKPKDSNKPLLTSTGVKTTTSASGSKPSDNTKNNRITRPPRSNMKNKIIMANLPPPNNHPNVLEDEHVLALEHAFIAPNPTPIQPNDYLADNEELKKEEEHIPEQAPADEEDDEEMEEEDVEEMEEDDDEEIEEEDVEEMEEEEDEEEEEIVAEDEAEIIYPYDEADPNNRPPPASDDESEFAHFVIPVLDVENRPVPHVIHFSSTYQRGVTSFVQEILKDVGEVYERIVKKIDRSDLRIQMVGCDAMSLDGVVRECQANVSKVISIMESMSLEFDRVRKESR